MSAEYERILKAYESIKDRIPFTPKVGLVLGSGLGDFADSEWFKVESYIDYKDIEGFPVSTAPGHKGRFVFGYVEGVPVVCMQGRVHYYEGYSMKDVVMPHRIMKLMGIEILFLTNASGGIKRCIKQGTLMLLTDQITCFVDSPLIGENVSELGVRFPDMSCVYDKELRKKVELTALEQGIDLEQGVYVQLKGPNYETPAEIAMIRAMGGDCVGMSTGVEAQAARHMGIRVVGITCITNLASGISPNLLSEEEVIETGKRVGKEFARLVANAIKRF